MLKIITLIIHYPIFGDARTSPTTRRRNPLLALSIGLSALMSSVLLAGCGGDSSTSVASSVSSIQADRLSYRQITEFKVAGTALDSSVTASAKNCAGLVEVTPASSSSSSASSAERVWRCTPTATGSAAVELQIKGAGANVLKSQAFAVPDPQVTMVTSLGSLVVELNPTAAPVTVDNFLQYVRDGFYTKTFFHRVIGGFVAQGGWLVPTATAPVIQTGARPSITLESNKGLANLRGSIAMARTNDPNSATSQFYFNLVDNAALNYVNDAQPGYAVFGRVVLGLNVMDAIGAVPTTSRYGLSDFPSNDVLVQSTTQTK